MDVKRSLTYLERFPFRLGDLAASKLPMSLNWPLAAGAFRCLALRYNALHLCLSLSALPIPARREY